ncbi:glycosyltransferase family 2 protein [Solibacillus sp. MA9]|uniref:Glycosyltransferase family 2 protein n=1 Tax=Solibacillus palustris TaxID=2908203 RepID=A0ABS9U8P7_9BACL|nr:glycosyltransferase family 2 protein [Solibacillus sp. MA9]MCH7320608.1 glycosyltransferase family 2 protein [Solibacillus sp. MA9]
MPKISVIIPIYNKGNRLKTTIQSVLDQSYQDFEIILINDGSTDNTDEIIQFYKEQYPTKINCYSQTNKGVSATRNFGMTVSKGDYISFLDADDSYHRDFLQETMVQVNEKGSDVILTKHHKHFLSSGKLIQSKMKINSRDILKDFILGKIDANTDSWLIKKTLLNDNQICFNEALTFGEDMLFFIEVLTNAHNPSCVLKELTTYNIGVENSLSSNSIDKIYKDIEWITLAVQYISKHCNDESRKLALLSALECYRLPAAIVYRLHLNKTVENYSEHKTALMKYIKKFRFNNGLRSIKLFKAIRSL